MSVHGRKPRRAGDGAQSLVRSMDAPPLLCPEQHTRDPIAEMPWATEAEKAISATAYVSRANQSSPSTYKGYTPSLYGIDATERAESPSHRYAYSSLPGTDLSSLGDSSGRAKYTSSWPAQRMRQVLVNWPSLSSKIRLSARDTFRVGGPTAAAISDRLFRSEVLVRYDPCQHDEN